MKLRHKIAPWALAAAAALVGCGACSGDSTVESRAADAETAAAVDAAGDGAASSGTLDGSENHGDATVDDAETTPDASGGDASVDAAADSGGDDGHDADTSTDTSTDGAPDVCPTYATPREVGHLPPELGELSGLAVDPARPGVLWGHNDSGDQARVYAFDSTGALLATVSLDGVLAVDWEDMATGPCGDHICLYIGDTGDNLRSRPSIRVHRFVVPELVDATLSAETMVLTYPDLQADCEAMVIGDDETVYLLTKEGRAFELYSARFSASDAPTSLTLLGRRDIRDTERNAPALVTGADRLPASERVIVRTYENAFELRAPGGVEGILTAPHSYAPTGVDRQGESIAYDPAGGYWHASEGDGAAIYRVECAE